MTATQSRQEPGKIITLAEEHRQADNLWLDAIKRLVRNRMAVLGLVIILLLILTAIFAEQLAPKSYEVQVLTDNNAAPQWVIDLFPVMKSIEDGGYVKVSNDYPLGADDLGRDILSRIIYGSRISLAIAFVGPLVSMLLGVPLGLAAGFFGGRVDNIIMRIVDIFYAFPTLLIIILMMAYFRGAFNESSQAGTLGYSLYLADRAMGGMLFIFIGVGLTSWVGLARLTRGEVLSARERDYVLAARSLGATHLSIMFRHVMPNVVGPLIVAETLTIPVYIRYEAFLSFIGLGVNRPTPSWGSMISDGAQTISSYPNQAIFPAVALFLVMFAFNFLGDGLRDALDPRMRGID
ncbi:MAG: ABC transporter permease [Anaerolineae bacterium]|nr:ABC transporter permease [Anaerolineae bacterium]